MNDPKTNRMSSWLLLFSFLFFLPQGISAQITLAEAPRSADNAIGDILQRRALPLQTLSAVDISTLLAEDRNFPGDRFAAPQAVDLGLNNSGQWTELPNGDRIWRLHVRVPDAKGLALLYDRFFLPDGARLHVYRPDRQQVIGAYTNQNNPPTGRFLTGFVRGEEVVVEYYEPQEVANQGQVHIFRIDQVYKDGMFGDATLRSSSSTELGFGTSFPCHANINCSEGADYQTEKRGIMRILVVVEEGSGFCTGNLMNNTREDGRPLVLSAFHCQDGFTPLFDLYRFDFNFEASACANPGAEPSRQSILGCTRLAGRQENDFILFELFSTVPASFNPYYLGWDRSANDPQAATLIHHPRGDIKKIAFDQDPARVFTNVINWNNDVTTPANHHFILSYDVGAFEIGSSGGALLDQNRRVVGQLHGGTSNCSSTTAYFGRLHLSWEGGGTPATRLRDWLDPDDTGAVTLGGRDAPVGSGLTVSGMITTETGTPVPEVRVLILGDAGTTLSTTTDASGLFTFSDLPAGDTYELDFSRPGEVLNGVSTLDLIQVQRHILNINPLQSPYQMLAADVNLSGSITTLDLIFIRRVILGVRSDFDPLPAWLFVPVDGFFVDPLNPFAGIQQGAYILDNLQSDVLDFDLLALKPGDVNSSATVE